MIRRVRTILLAGALLASMAAPALAGGLNELEFRLRVEAPRAEVWRAWSSAEGLQTFFGRKAVLEPYAEGRFAVHFAPDNPPGRRGAEDLSIMAFEPEERIAFSWSAPPQWPEIRRQRAFVEVLFDDSADGTTLVTLRHYGWGRGEDWAAVRTYFADAWKVVLGRLQYRFRQGPVDWDNPPDRDIYQAAE